MSQALLNKIWSFLGVALLYLSLNAWSVTQQWQLTLPGNPFKDGKTTPHGVAVYGLFLCAPLIIVISVVTRLYGLRSRSNGWANRLPRFGDFELDTKQVEARAFQAIMLCLFLLLPSGAVLHFQNKVMTGSVFRIGENCTPSSVNGYCRSNEASIRGWREMLFSTPKDTNVKGRLVYDPDLSKDIAPTFVPLWEPWSLLMLSALTLGFVVWSLKAVMKRHSK